MIPQKFPSVLQMCLLLPVWISKNIYKNTKPCEFTCVKNKELLALFWQQILRTLKMLKCQKPKNIRSLNWILLVLVKKKVYTLPDNGYIIPAVIVGPAQVFKVAVLRIVHIPGLAILPCDGGDLIPLIGQSETLFSPFLTVEI